jgi:Ribonuclease G/E
VSKKVREEITKIAAVTDSDVILVNVHPDVAVSLAGEEDERLKNLEKKLQKEIYLRSDDHYHVEEIKISAI